MRNLVRSTTKGRLVEIGGTMVNIDVFSTCRFRQSILNQCINQAPKHLFLLWNKRSFMGFEDLGI
jgi:hypothetical protein